MTLVAPEEPVLLCAPQIAAIGWRDDGDPLVDLRDVVGLRLDRRLADARGSYAHLRRNVARRLLLAQASLPHGLELLVIEGYRPPALQRRYFDDYAAELGELHADWAASRRHREASKFVSPPEVAPHGTGGAVDLTLCTTSGVELDLGTPVNASPEASRGACYTASPDITPQARARRTVLANALTGAGLVNYPTEWWHWSYGERYWALVHGEPVTRYGPVDSVAVLGRTGATYRLGHAHPDPNRRAGEHRAGVGDAPVATPALRARRPRAEPPALRRPSSYT